MGNGGKDKSYANDDKAYYGEECIFLSRRHSWIIPWYLRKRKGNNKADYEGKKN